MGGERHRCIGTLELWGEFVGLGLWLNTQDRSKMKTKFEMVPTNDCVRIQRNSQMFMTEGFTIQLGVFTSGRNDFFQVQPGRAYRSNER
jgi:hypothetical protein